MNIQSNINQMVSLAGLLVSQTPMAAAAKEKAVEQQKLKGLQKNIGKAEAATEEVLKEYDDAKGSYEQAAAEELFTSSFEKEATAQEELFYANPTAEGARSVVRYKAALAGHKDRLEDIAKEEASMALQKEQERIANSNQIVKSLDISNIDERALPRLERAYKKAQRDTKYLTKKGGNE